MFFVSLFRSVAFHPPLNFPQVHFHTVALYGIRCLVSDKIMLCWGGHTHAHTHLYFL